MYSLSRKNFDSQGTQQSLISLPGLLIALVAHAAIFYFLWNQRLITPPQQMVTLFAELIAAPVPVSDSTPHVAPEPVPVKIQPARKPEIKSPKREERLAAKSSVVPKQQVVETLPEPFDEPIAEQINETTHSVAALPAQIPAEPVTLSSELSVSCPKLSAPAYPAISRRMGEEGKLVLRVELDEKGHIDDAKVINSSGYERLDAAALTAVKNWQCNPSLRNGQPVRAVALQPFNFVLQGN
ncbi:MAG: energy transducer TonB [Nitrosomonas sp. PRO4]|nr:energy transducer TonB [Nitrosomonas sp. PRO4]